MKAALAVFCAGATAVFACIGSPDARSTPAAPDRATFPPVGQYLVHRCGSLDCHGNMNRNLRLYGDEAMRLSTPDRIAASPTTEAELDANYTGVVLLEPEAMSAVVSDRGAEPERLALVRKARGLDNHKGASVVTPNDDQDRCLTSWLSGTTDVAACQRASSMK